MSDMLKSVIRTIVPVIVGLILSAAVKAGLDIDEQTLTQIVDAAVIGGYYALIRFGESRYPAVGWFLGLPVSPQYATEHPPVVEDDGASDDIPLT
jgi:hypothetical protein